MNSGTLVGALIFAAVLVMAIAIAIQLMMLGWRRRARRQDELIGNLPEVQTALLAQLKDPHKMLRGAALGAPR